jgi:tRNA dimethylallyltransferase
MSRCGMLTKPGPMITRRGRADVPRSAGTRRREAPPVVALFGATALGKTAVAVALAERLDADIVVADSMQVYAGLPILTNQPDAAQRSRARHHLVGFVAPQQEFTVADYARRAHAVIDGLRADGRGVVVEGGSGLYLRAALGDLDFAAAPDLALRRDLEVRWADDASDVVQELRRLDPATYACVDTANPRRVIRALEAVHARGDRPLPTSARDRLWQVAERYPHQLLALIPDGDRSRLNVRLGERVDAMLAAGALDEVAAVRIAGPLGRTAMQAIGVRELCAVLDGELGLEVAAARMKARTRALVRSQLTWMRKLPAVAQVAACVESPEAAADAILDVVRARAW